MHDDRADESPAAAGGADPRNGAVEEPATAEPGANAGAASNSDPDGSRRPRWALLLGVAGVVLALDQASKAWAVSALGDGSIVDLVGSLRLRLTFNYGSAFSIANGRGALISILALAVVAVLLATGRNARTPAMAVALGLVVGGAFGNLVDRAFREGDGLLGGGVVDFVDLQWWPVFNVADAAIVVGALLLFVVQWREADESSGEGDGRSEAPSTEPD